MRQRASPEPGRNMPARNRMVVDLPATLGPKRPNISPEFIDKLSWFTTTKSPNRRVILCVSIEVPYSLLAL